ncbi:MAG: PcfJ domain-containing protein [Oscillospiraceae bacterium]|nr:PcfJ domain-containing protein [Oscillospiraceae bacterium]
MLNKRSLRQFAVENPTPAIPPNHGLLAPQVEYIIRTAVRNIGHHRTLVLYVYDRKRAVGGDPAPVWAVFQAGDDYISLARKEDGSIHWREAAFERLGEDYHFTGSCAFYSAQDEQRVCGFFRNHDHGGIAVLVRAQRAILDKRCQERQRQRERQTIRRMCPIHALPRGWQRWAKRSVMPAYFFYDYRKGTKTVPGICSACGENIALTGARHNARAVCPHCKRELTMKAKGRMGRIMDRDTVQFIQRTGPDELVVRIVKIYHIYDQDTAKREFCENARIFVRRGPDGKVTAEPYYYSYGKGALTHWIPGERPVFFKYSYNFEADACGHVYCRNLPGALTGTHWEYCPVTAFYEHFREPMQLWPFLAAHVEHPKLEHLIKVGFFNLASDLAYGRIRDNLLDETQDRTHRLLGVAADDVMFLRGLDVDTAALRIFQQYAGIKDRQQLFLWQREHGVDRDVAQCLERMTPHKLMRYLEQQYPVLRTRKAQYGGQRYRDMQSVASEYRDYLDMCVKLGYDMKNSFVLYPRDLQQAHDTAQRRVKAKADSQLRRDFKEAMRAISGHLDFEAEGMRLLLPATPEELAAEGNALHHYVGSYADRVAKKECIILFLRQCGDLAKPFYTVEIRGMKIAQVRGMSNCPATPEVNAFMDRWEQQVLQAPAIA